jgi:DGQHR domain-containing protein
MKIRYLEVKQPIGSFYLCSVEASILSKCTTIERRGESPDSVQREESKIRVKEISEYCGESDATFPTPIIVAVDLAANVQIDQSHIEFDPNDVIGEVIDGQHRLLGLKRSEYINNFQLPVVFMFDMMPSQKAYVFSIINSKQTRVNMSLIYDLFALSETRSPYKTCHEIARAFNRNSESPYFKRLKMLGKKEDDQYLASISQGSFIKNLLELVSKKPDEDTRNLKNGVALVGNIDLPLRQYFIDEKDAVISKILLNLFRAIKIVFPKEWDNPNEYILSKSIGFSAIIKSFKVMYTKGMMSNDLSEDYFIELYRMVSEDFEKKGIVLTSDNYGSNEQARTKLTNDIISAINGNEIPDL